MRTIQRRLDKVGVKSDEPDAQTAAVGRVIVTDTTYFGRSFGVLAIVDAHKGKMLHREFNEQLVRAKRERLKRARIRDCGDSVRWPERAVSFVRKHTDPDVPVSSNCDHHKVFDKKA